MDVYLIAIRVAKLVDPDQTPCSVVSDLGLHCLFSGLSFRMRRVVLTLRNPYVN